MSRKRLATSHQQTVMMSLARVKDLSKAHPMRLTQHFFKKILEFELSQLYAKATFQPIFLLSKMPCY